MAGASNNGGFVIVVFDDVMRLAFMLALLQSGPTLREQQEDSKVGMRRALNADATPLILFARALCATLLLRALLLSQSHSSNCVAS